MHVFNVLIPVMVLIALGSGLARIGFMGREFIGGLNKLTYWVALPALIFRAAASAGMPPVSSLWIALSVIAATLCALGFAVALAAILKQPAHQRRTFVECAFFGNLAYIGLPILAHSLGLVSVGERPELLATTVIAMTILTVLNNLLVMIVLQPRGVTPLRMAGHLAFNPVVMGGFLGIAWGAAGLELPVALDRSLQTLGGMAVPAALLCIGGSLLSAPLRGRLGGIAVSTLVKIAALPVAAWLFALWLGLSPADTRIVLIFAACPTAAAAYTMASQMGGDESFAAGAIAASTVAAFASLALALVVT
jgi:predicted permease